MIYECHNTEIRDEVYANSQHYIIFICDRDGESKKEMLLHIIHALWTSRKSRL